MNIFYAPPEQIRENYIELTGQEAIHASKTLRYRASDEISVVNGQGDWYDGLVSQTSPDEVIIKATDSKHIKPILPPVTLAQGIIKKRDRLEFAVEKAIELGAREIVLFRGEHSVKQNVRMDRLKTLAVSAMKQSLQAWLPEIRLFRSLSRVLKHYSKYQIYAAHKSGEWIGNKEIGNNKAKYLLITGPEGDFSTDELQLLRQKEVSFISLGPNRLRAETAAVAFLNGFMLVADTKST